MSRFAARGQSCVAEGGVAAGQEDSCAQLGQVEQGVPELGTCGAVEGSFPSWQDAFQIVGDDQGAACLEERLQTGQGCWFIGWGGGGGTNPGGAAQGGHEPRRGKGVVR